MNPSASPENPQRREFLKGACCVALGGLATLVPVGAGVVVLLDPLRRGGAGGQTLRDTSLEALPEDGQPRKFAVVADRSDAWNKYPHVPIGAVYLRRTGPAKVEALNVMCPHAGCFVDFLPERGSYLCPCHNSTFALDGAIKDASSPAARPLDSLEVEIRNQSEVWVKFQNFRAGTTEKIAQA